MTIGNMHPHAVDSNPVFVSEVIGDGADAHRIVRVGEWSMVVRGADDTAEPEIPDTLLAPRLGLPLHKLRQLSARHEQAGNVAPRVSTTVVETGGRPGKQRFYTEADALFLVTRSEAAGAVALTREMIRVFMLARRGLLRPVAPQGITAEKVAEMIAAAMAARPQLAESVDRMILGRDADGLVLAPVRRMAASLAAPRATRAERARHVGRLHSRIRRAIGWDGMWRLFPRHRLGDLLVAVRDEEIAVERIAAELVRSRQFSLKVA